MPRSARIIAVDYPHHITQRGNFKQNIFEEDQDYKIYLNRIEEYRRKYNLIILSYCLMPNHVHFIATPNNKDSISKTFNISHMRYSQYMNKKMKRNGHLWQGRFFSCILSDESYLMMCARYIERNPVRAKITPKPWKWNWSSAQAHTERGKSIITLGDLFKFIPINKRQWEDYIDTDESKKLTDEIKIHTLVGRPLGDIQAVEKLSTELRQKFPMAIRGRPRKI
jgi:putative transposase